MDVPRFLSRFKPERVHMYEVQIHALLEELSVERMRQIVVRSSMLQAQLVTVSLPLKAFSSKLEVFLPSYSPSCKLISLLKGQRKIFRNT